jgi:hypothetical protein
VSDSPFRKSVGSEAALHEIIAALRSAGEAGEPACALCRRTAGNVAREVRAFVSEYVNDPQTREGWRRAQGFCSEHTPLLASIGDSLALAILYSDLARLTQERWRATGVRQIRTRLPNALRRSTGDAPSAACPACDMAKAADARNAAALAQGLMQEDREAWEALEAGAGLCVGHSEQVIQRCSPAVAARLRAMESERLAALQAELEEIIRKNDYRFRGEPWGPEKDAWLRALHKLKRPQG